MLVLDAETILDAADLARDAGFTTSSDRPLTAVIFFTLLCLGGYSINMSTLVDRGTINRLDKGVYGFVDPLLKEHIRESGIISISTDEKD